MTLSTRFYAAALYVDPRGPYPKIGGVDVWDEQRDARVYAGPLPVIAHPPCGPWGNLRAFCTKQDRSLAPVAVEQVRRWGGVLEHPQGSKLWPECGLPKPGEPPDASGGFSVQVEQVAWGHKATKATWLYFVGVDRNLVERTRRTGGTPTHVVSQTRGKNARGLKRLGDDVRHLTPPAFAEWLVTLVRTVREGAAYACPRCRGFGRPDTDDCCSYVCADCGFAYSPTF